MAIEYDAHDFDRYATATFNRHARERIESSTRGECRSIGGDRNYGWQRADAHDRLFAKRHVALAAALPRLHVRAGAVRRRLLRAAQPPYSQESAVGRFF